MAAGPDDGVKDWWAESAEAEDPSKTDLHLPYQKHTPQVMGRKVEPGMARKLGARLHPNSGAGKIKDDASNEDTVYEFKNANRSFTLNGSDLSATHARAVRQGKEGVWVITFANGITAEIHLIGGRAQT